MKAFQPTDAHRWQKGSLFLGADDHGNPVGISTERHAITIAGSQSGKGVGVIVPNLLRWPHNALVIDPKGEAAKLTVEARAAMGCPSFVFDPFERADVPDDVRVTINPMDRLDPESFTITEDIGVIADGLVMRANPDSAYWDNGAVTIIAGLIAYVLLHLPQDEQNLLSVRRILRDDDLFATVVDEMRKEEGLGGLCQSAASAIMAKEGSYFVSNAQANTKWLDSLAMQKALAATSFDMSQLKWGNASLFLALPSKYIKEHGRFLRLFVRTAIDVMQEEHERGEIKGKQCLFLLDEFFTLGYIDEIAQSAGLMAGYGLKLWPILQDIEQLRKLYGKDGAATFFGSADLHQFFGNMDDETLDFISKRIGNYDVHDLPPEPQINHEEINRFANALKAEKSRAFPDKKRIWKLEAAVQAEWFLAEELQKQNLAQFKTDASRIIGKPRIPPDKIGRLIAKPQKGPSERMIAIVHGGAPLVVRLWPYYLDQTTNDRPIVRTSIAQQHASVEPPTKPKTDLTTKNLSNSDRAKLIALKLEKLDRSTFTSGQKQAVDLFEMQMAFRVPEDLVLGFVEQELGMGDAAPKNEKYWGKLLQKLRRK